MLTSSFLLESHHYRAHCFAVFPLSGEKGPPKAAEEAMGRGEGKEVTKFVHSRVTAEDPI